MPTATVYFTDIRALYNNNGASQGADTFQTGEDNTFNEIFRTCMKPDFASAGIPAGSTFTSVLFKAWLEQAGSFRSSNNRILRCYRLLRAYTTAATWATYNGTNNWGTAGASNTTTDREGTDIGTVTCLTSWADESSHEWALDAAEIQEMFDGVLTNNGLIFKQDTENADRYFWHSTTSGKEPRLTIEYDLPDGIPGLIHSPGVIPV